MLIIHVIKMIYKNDDFYIEIYLELDCYRDHVNPSIEPLLTTCIRRERRDIMIRYFTPDGTAAQVFEQFI